MAGLREKWYLCIPIVNHECAMKRVAILLLGLLTLLTLPSRAAYLLVPMDHTQTNHLKAYGVAYFVLQREIGQPPQHRLA